ncbi:class I SAM-dependent methyltransferase [Sphingomonas sp. BT-65]|uniref:class I SAM-dependent DNA methyltransferase n=1 Tax=Sphingomonas sp. BT-65 TaxID=2989821 RepID=UPI002236561B|nr:class I SAM-dependent methyltransferase [Sphingomonas sp. BT-65]MCW4460633.1 class I SAM-dependent methyltransferase [Sphingomonas sp. BT-65]
MPDRIAELYQRHALAFDAARRRGFPERAWFDRFIRHIPAGGEILDLGCGGGEPVARYLVDRGYQLTGVDIAPSMIKLARTRFARHRWIEGDMRKFGAESSAYDGIIAWSSLFHLDPQAQEKLIPRISIWLKRGGVALFNTGPANGVAIGEIEGEELFHASLDPGEYRALFARSGLAVIGNIIEDANCGGMTVWLVGKV